MLINVDIPFDWFQIVYLKTDGDQKPFIVIGIEVFPDGEIQVMLRNGTSTSSHHPKEIAETKDYLLSTTN